MLTDAAARVREELLRHPDKGDTWLHRMKGGEARALFVHVCAAAGAGGVRGGMGKGKLQITNISRHGALGHGWLSDSCVCVCRRGMFPASQCYFPLLLYTTLMNYTYAIYSHHWNQQCIIQLNVTETYTIPMIYIHLVSDIANTCNQLCMNTISLEVIEVTK